MGKQGRNEVTKKCRAAVWLRADTLAFATKADQWSNTNRTTIQSAVRGFNDWGPLGEAQILLISGLGTSDVRIEPL